jgi:hypothetical protein
VSEYGKICRKYPEKATEIRTGALNAVQAGQLVFIESTAEGRSGHFFDLCQRAQARAQQGKKLTALDWKFNFFPWWKHPEYRIDPDHVIITAGGREYFEELELKHGIALTAEQRAWYVKKLEDQGDEMKREFPSTPDEAFEAAIQGAYYGKQMAQARKEGRITRVPYDPALLVDTWWDLGMSDQTAIWFTQSTRSGEIRVIDYYEASGEGLPHYANVLAGKGYVYGTHHGPHDLAVRELGTGKSRIETAKALGIKFVTVANIPVQDGIEASRSLLARCWFDEERCAPGIRALCEYQKEWSDERGMYLDRPRHDWTSHGADGFRYMAVGHKDLTDKKPEKGRSAGGRAGWMGA